MAEYKVMSKAKRDAAKDVGGYTQGVVVGGRRKAGSIEAVYLLIFDLDYAKPELVETLQVVHDGYAWFVVSTHSSTPETLKLRLGIPLRRPVTGDESQAIKRRIAEQLGMDQFDATTFQVERFYYWPSVPKDAKYIYETNDAPWLDPDSILSTYADWRDVSQWPRGVNEEEHREKPSVGEDPRNKPGPIGRFCREYPITEAIATFLPDRYEQVADRRYTYLQGSAWGGALVLDDDTKLHSYHHTDPATGQHNAFDMVRLHLFGELDADAKPDTPVTRLPSYLKMVELVEADERVAERHRQERLAAVEADFGEEQKPNPKTLFFDNGKFVPMLLGEWFMARHHCLVIAGELYVYQGGVYAPGQRIFDVACTEVLGMAFSPKRLTDSLAYVKNTAAELTPVEALGGDLLNLPNGLLDPHTRELHPHTPDYHSTTQLPVVYDPEATCPAIDEFLRYVVPADAVPVIEEMIGYCLIPTMQYETSFVLYGGGGNGKGTLLAVITAMLGQQNVSSVALQALAENRFAAADLFGKMMNAHADLPSKVIEDSSLFKAITSGDLVRVERKHQQGFDFHNRAKLLFSANEPPVSRDNTEGYHRRWVIIPFPNKFTDRGLRKRLFEPEELSGLLNRALVGLARLTTQDGFSYSASVRKSLEAYRAKSDTVYRFVDECCDFTDGKALTPKQAVYNAYRSACFDWGNSPVNQANFNERLLNLKPDLTEFRKGSPRQWRGLKLTVSDFLE